MVLKLPVGSPVTMMQLSAITFEMQSENMEIYPGWHISLDGTKMMHCICLTSRHFLSLSLSPFWPALFRPLFSNCFFAGSRSHEKCDLSSPAPGEKKEKQKIVESAQCKKSSERVNNKKLRSFCQPVTKTWIQWKKMPKNPWIPSWYHGVVLWAESNKKGGWTRRKVCLYFPCVPRTCRVRQTNRFGFLFPL